MEESKSVNKILTLIGLLSLVCVSFVNSTDVISITRDAIYCKKDNRSIFECDLNSKPGKLLAQRWKNDWKGFEIKNTTSLIIEQQCNATEKEILLQNCHDINIKPDISPDFRDCKVRLRLENCEGGVLKELFNLINVKESSLDTISLVVDQFDITAGSEIGDLDVKSTRKLSTVIDSKVDVVTRMEVEGGHKLEITNSVIGEVRKFVYNSTFKDSRIMNTTFGNLVMDGGFSVMQGSLIIENVLFKSLQSQSIILSGGTTIMRGVDINEANLKSIVMRGSDTVLELVGIVVGEDLPFSLMITSKGDRDIFPLSLISFGCQLKPEVSGAIGFFLGVLFGMAVLVICKRCRRMVGKGNRKENIQLPLTSVSAHAADTKPPPPTPLVNHPNQKSNDQENADYNDDYYSDVQIPTTSLPPLPKVPSSLATGSIVPQVSKQGDVPSAAIQPKKPDDNVEEEEPIYDECENYQSPPPPALTMNQKPVLPTKFKLPSNSDRRDDPSIDPPNGQQTPLITNKPVGNKPSFLHAIGKPPPPPRVTTKGVVAPPSKPQPKLPKHLFEQGRSNLTKPPQRQKEQAGNRGNDGHDEDIYEPVPDF